MNVRSDGQALFMTDFDQRRLLAFFGVLRARTALDHPRLRELEARLKGARVVSAEDIPQSVVTMNSKVRLRDLASEETFSVNLVFPGAGEVSRGFVSVLAPLGVALLGAREGDELPMNGAKGSRRLRVEEVEYQPEAAGDSAR